MRTQEYVKRLTGETDAGGGSVPARLEWTYERAITASAPRAAGFEGWRTGGR